VGNEGNPPLCLVVCESRGGKWGTKGHPLYLLLLDERVGGGGGWERGMRWGPFIQNYGVANFN
jgi:hypothetical protein